MIKLATWTNPPAIIQPFEETRRQAVRRIASTDMMDEEKFVEEFFNHSIAFLRRAHENIHKKYPKMFG